MGRLGVAATVLPAIGVLGAFPVWAGWESRISAEMEYQGENYRNESVIDLPSPDAVSDRVVEVTKFSDDTWLPGNRLEFLWSPDSQLQLDLRSNTGYNARRFYQELDGRLSIPASNGYWYLRTFGALREESESFIGHGDWNVGTELRRQFTMNQNWAARLEGRYRHSRTRGDTLSFVYDYDRTDITLRVMHSGAGRSVWEGYATGTFKKVPRGFDGSYSQAALGAVYRPPLGRRLYFAAEARSRTYDQTGTVGRDFLELDASARGTAMAGESNSLLAELEFLGADYRDQDDLYYDFAQLTGFFPWECRGTQWTTLLGPRVRLLWDTQNGTRNYRQFTMRGEATRVLGVFGFGQFSLEGGYRDYRGGSETIEVDSLSGTLLRSDYWVIDAMILANVPLGGPFSLEVLADSALEVHQPESERIHVTFANIAVTTSF